MISSLQLDVGNVIIGADFIKLVAAGSINLATEAFVANAVGEGGGGGGGAGTDLTSYYNKSETDNFFNIELSINNPQDMAGRIRKRRGLGASIVFMLMMMVKLEEI